MICSIVRSSRITVSSGNTLRQPRQTPPSSQCSMHPEHPSLHGPSNPYCCSKKKRPAVCRSANPRNPILSARAPPNLFLRASGHLRCCSSSDLRAFHPLQPPARTQSTRQTMAVFVHTAVTSLLHAVWSDRGETSKTRRSVPHLQTKYRRPHNRCSHNSPGLPAPSRPHSASPLS